jgi:O-antigen/teichoic acid export membrane protein
MKKTIEHLASVIGGEAAVRAANFVAALFIARVYGVSVLGVYAACLAVVTVVVMFADNGLQTSAITELSDFPGARGQILGQLYLSKTILSVAALLLLAGFALWMKFTPFVWGIGVWVTLRTVLQSYSQLQMSVFKAMGKANLIGVIQFIHSLLLLMWICMAFIQNWAVFVVLAGLTAGQLFELTLMILALRRAGIRPARPEHIRFWQSMRKSTPFGITYGLANLTVRSDTIVLSTLVPVSELGNFSAANSILLVVYVASWLFGSVLLPEMVRMTALPESLKIHVKKWARLIALALTPCALLVFFTAPKLMILLFGPAFYRSGALASIMALAWPFIFLNSVYTSLAIATNCKNIFMGLFAATAVVAVILDLLLGRPFGSMGVASAIVIREAGMLAGFWFLTSRVAASASPLGCPVSS